MDYVISMRSSGVTLTRRCRGPQCGEKTSYSPHFCGEYLDFSPQMAKFACRQALLSLIEGLYVCVIVIPIANISGSGRNGPGLSGMRSGCWVRMLLDSGEGGRSKNYILKI